MKKLLCVVFGIVLWPCLCFGADDGGSLFKSMGCMSCHHPEKSSFVSPSLVDIAQAYDNNRKELILFLNGQAAARVKPQEAEMMKAYLKKTEALTDLERAALADFILGHQK